jgi:hypothetical protein
MSPRTSSRVLSRKKQVKKLKKMAGMVEVKTNKKVIIIIIIISITIPEVEDGTIGGANTLYRTTSGPILWFLIHQLQRNSNPQCSTALT